MRLPITVSFIVAVVVISSAAALAQQTTKKFTVDFAKPMERIKDLAGVNAGPDAPPAKGQSGGGSVTRAYIDAGVSLIRTLDVDDLQYQLYAPQYWRNGALNRSFDPTQPSSYSWGGADLGIDTIVSPGFAPYFHLGVGFAAAKGIYGAAPVDADGIHFSTFAELCKRTVMHYNGGWDGGHQYGIRYWEIWNEPDGGFWRDSVAAPAGKPGDSVAFARMFREVADSMRRADPSIKIGGPGILSGTVMTKRAWLTTFLTECKTNHVPLDFFSWHLYGALNPYAIVTYATYVRGQLDSYGFTTAESIVSEFNIRLGQVDAASSKPLMNTPKHGAFMASSMIAAQISSIDRLMTYRGPAFMNLFENDTLGAARPTLSGRGFMAFTELARVTPQRIAADSSEFIATEAAALRDTTNVMIMAGRSDDGLACDVLVSNYNSAYSASDVTVKNLPWAANGNVSVHKTTMTASGAIIDSTITIQSGSSITIPMSGFTAPAFALIRLTYQPPTGISERAASPAAVVLEQNIPNPMSATTTIGYTIPTTGHVRLTIVDLLGSTVATLIDCEQPAGHSIERWTAGRLPAGVYLCRLQAAGVTRVRPLVVAR